MDNTNEDRHKQYLICFQHPARKFVAWIKKQLSNKIKNYSVRKMCEVIPTMKIQKIIWFFQFMYSLDGLCYQPPTVYSTKWFPSLFGFYCLSCCRNRCPKVKTRIGSLVVIYDRMTRLKIWVVGTTVIRFDWWELEHTP